LICGPATTCDGELKNIRTHLTSVLRQGGWDPGRRHPIVYLPILRRPCQRRSGASPSPMLSSNE
jgi:hypothetical protein